MSDPTTSRTRMAPGAVASRRPRSLACPRARHAPCVLELLAPGRPGAREAMESIIWSASAGRWGAAERLVVGEPPHLLDRDLGGGVAADRAVGVALDLELGEGGRQRVVEQQPADQRL